MRSSRVVFRALVGGARDTEPARPRPRRSVEGSPLTMSNSAAALDSPGGVLGAEAV